MWFSKGRKYNLVGHGNSWYNTMLVKKDTKKSLKDGGRVNLCSAGDNQIQIVSRNLDQPFLSSEA